MIGSLLNAAVCCRPDISFAVGNLSKYMARPQVQHMTAAKRVLRYLKGTRLHGLMFSADSAESPLVGYSDADWAGETETRLSTSGYLFVWNGTPVSWKAKLQSSVALSTAEAEYVSLCTAAQEAVFLRALLKDLKLPVPEPTTINEDNQSCIALTNNMISNARTKHIDIRYHYTREKVASGEICIKYCPTKNMLADIFTKPLNAPRHKELCSILLKSSKSNLSSGSVEHN